MVTRTELYKYFQRARDTGWNIEEQYFPDKIQGDYYPTPTVNGECRIFRALELIRPSEVNFVILGQDPYFDADRHGVPYATGVAFAIPPNSDPPARSFARLMNHLRERDFAYAAQNFEAWVRERGILMLNAALTLTVEPDNPGSHLKLKHWHKFVQKIIEQVRGARGDGAKYIAWGSHAGPIMRDALDGKHPFTWTCHPEARQGETSFAEFWTSALGQELRQLWHSQ